MLLRRVLLTAILAGAVGCLDAAPNASVTPAGDGGVQLDGGDAARADVAFVDGGRRDGSTPDAEADSGGVATPDADGGGSPALDPMQLVPAENAAWLVRADGQSVFLCGYSDMEDFLYRGERNEDGTIVGGRQLALLYSVANSGSNAISAFLVRSHGGDGDQVLDNPFVGGEPSASLNTAVLDQWEEWFEKARELGIYVYVVIYDDEVQIWDSTSSTIEDEEEAFIRAIVDRFEHLPNLIWVPAEEHRDAMADAHALALVELIREVDDFDHPIAISPDYDDDFDNFTGHEAIDQRLVYTGSATVDGLVSVADEQITSAFGLDNVVVAQWQAIDPATDPSAEPTTSYLWPLAMSGGYLFVGPVRPWHDDEYADEMARCGQIATFLGSVPIHRTRPADDLAAEATEAVLAAEGELYIGYTSAGVDAAMGIAVSPGSYDVRWLDVREDREVASAMTSVGADGEWASKPPEGLTGGEYVVVLTKRLTP